MCPDARLLSAYHDNEVPEPWKARIHAHLEECPACRATVGAFASQSALLQADRDLTLSPVSHRREEFWNRLGHSRMGTPRRSIRIVIPLPLVAAAVFALLVVGALNFIPLGEGRNSSDTIEILPPTPAVVSLSLEPQEMETLLNFLEGTETADEPTAVYWALPTDKPLARYGDPQLVRPADLEGGF